MWTTEITKSAKVPKSAIWELWMDVANWNKWDLDVEYSHLKGAFEKGTKGVLKPLSGPKTNFEITKVEEFVSFTNRSVLPFCTIDFIHEIYPMDEGISITHRIEMRGALAAFFSKIMGKSMAKGLKNAVEKLIEMTEDGK